MLEIFAVFCLLNSPTTCKDKSFSYSDENLTPMQLQVHSQAVIAKWMTEHPGHTVQRWGVRRAGLYAKT